MKRNAIIYMGILVLLMAAVTVWRMRPEPVEGSALYQRCKDMPGVRVGFIKDFPINDSLTCDVTTFEALTDSAWQALCADFALTDFVENIEEIAPHVVFSRQVSRHDYTQVVLGDSPDAECLAISCDSRTFAIFHTRNATEMNAVLYHNLTNKPTETTSKKPFHNL